MTFHSGGKYFLFFLLIALPLSRGAVEGWAISLLHIATWSAFILFLLERSLAWDWKRIRTPLDMPLFALSGLTLVSAIFSTHRYASFWSWLLLLDCILVYFLTIHTIRTRSDFRQVVWLIAFEALFLSILGFFKLIDANPFPWWNYHASNSVQGGLSSSYVNRNHMAGYLEMAIPLFLGLLLNGIDRARKALIIFIAGILSLALIFTLSRGGWIGLFVGMAFMSMTLFAKSIAKNRKLLFWCSIGILFCFISILSSTTVVTRVKTLEEAENNPSLSARITAWKGIVEMMRDYPLLGTGPGTFATIYTQYQPPGFKSRFMMGHNDYLHFTSEVGLGLVGIILWMGIIFYRTGFQKLKSPSRLVRGTTIGAMAGVTAILVHSVSDFNLHVPANAVLFTVLAALAVSPPPSHRAKHDSRIPQRILSSSSFPLPGGTKIIGNDISFLNHE